MEIYLYLEKLRCIEQSFSEAVGFLEIGSQIWICYQASMVRSGAANYSGA